MRIGWATDIHLDFVDEAGARAFGAEVAELALDRFVVTGDIANGERLVPLMTAMAEAAGPCAFVLGNHDFYGSDVVSVRAAATTLPSDVGVYLRARPPIRLGGEIVLTGVDGWGDARLGDPEGTPVRLMDFLHIQDLLTPDYAELLGRLREHGDAEAARAHKQLAAAVARGRHVIFATHVPPFREACWHEGALSDKNWLPFFTCDAVGRVLREVASAHPEHEFTVLCGHTHGEGEAQILDNLRVLTGGAEYGRPRCRVLEFSLRPSHA